MTVASDTSRVSFAGNGSTTAFALGAGFIFYNDTDLRVILRVDATGVETLQTLTTHYTVSGGSGATGTVTMVTAPATGETLIIRRELPLTQGADLVNNSDSDADVVETMVDRLVLIAQTLSEKIGRALSFSEGSPTSDVVFPEPEANKIPMWNAAGTALENRTQVDVGATTVSAFGATLVDDADAAAARNTLGATSGDWAIADGGTGASTAGEARTRLNAASLSESSRIENLQLSLTDSAGALTVHLATDSGGVASLSATNPVNVGMRSSTASSGSFAMRPITAATNLVISSGSTLGHKDAVAGNVFVYLIDNAGAMKVAVSAKYFGAHGIASTSAEGGAGAADDPDTMYSDATYTDKPFLCIGLLVSNQTTAGTWSSNSTKITDIKLAPLGPVRYKGKQRFTSSGTYTRSAGTITQRVRAVGAGGGGGASHTTNDQVGGGGQAGGYFEHEFVRAQDSATITIGAAGAGGVSTASGSAGGNTAWADGTNTFTAGGGAGGSNGSASPGPADSGGAVTGSPDFVITGQGGSWSGASSFGPVTNGHGGDSPLGFGGRAALGISTTTPATGYGAGGGGGWRTTVTADGQAGTAGYLDVEEWGFDV